MFFESLSHVINQESHVYSWNLGENYLVHFLIFWNLPRLTGEISKFQKSAIGKFIPNFPFKHVITSTYTKTFQSLSTEATTTRCSVRKGVLRISENSQENTCVRVPLLIKLQASGLWHRCFLANFPKFLRTPFLQYTSGRLLLCLPL